MLLCSIFVCMYKMLFIIGGNKEYIYTDTTQLIATKTTYTNK